MSSIIKMEEEEYPLSSPDHDAAFFNHCLTTFYDQDSEDIIQAKCSAQDVYCFLQHTIDICDTPLNEIMQLVYNNDNFKGVDLEIVKRKIIRQKNLLKRNRAKNRKAFAKEKKQIIELAVVASCDQEDEYKKQRNRISAQISRDKKKQKVKALQELNEKLQKQCEMQKLQNQRLREQFERTMENKGVKNGDIFKSKFAKLLILLGIVFLFGLLKDIFNFSNDPLAKINQNKTASFDLKNDPYYVGDAQQDKNKVLNTIELSLTQTVENKGIINRIKQKISLYMKGWSDQPWALTPKIREELKLIQHQALN